MSQIRVTVNGEARSVPAPATLASLIGHFGLEPGMVVAELNRRIVRRPELATTPVADGDSVELVHFVGGG